MNLIWGRHPLSQTNFDYLDDQLPDFSDVGLPDNGVVFVPPASAAAPTTAASSGGSTAMGQAGLIMGGIGDITKGVGGYMQGEEEAKADDYNAQLALIQGQFNVEQIGTQEEETLSTQKAMYSRAGVELSGSPLDVALNTATNYEYDKEVATFNAESQANMDKYEAAVAKHSGEYALSMGIIQGIGSMAMAGVAGMK